MIAAQAAYRTLLAWEANPRRKLKETDADWWTVEIERRRAG